MRRACVRLVASLAACLLGLASACSEGTVDIDPGTSRDASASIPVDGGGTAVADAGRTSLEIEIAYPDDDTRAVAPQVELVPIEPFLPRAGGGRELLGCGDVNPFAPTARLDPRSHPLAMAHPRERRDAADTARWPVDLDALGPFAPDNPWGAVLLYFSGGGRARDGAMTSDFAPLVRGCICVRADPSATFVADPALDAQVKAACPAVDGQRVRVPLGPLVGPPFRLEACGATEVTAARERVVEVQPGVCLRVGVCQDASADDCFACRTPTCNELEDLSAAPVRVRVQQGAGGTARAIDDVVLTGARGSVQPRVQVDGCGEPITVVTSIVGLGRPPVELPLRCVPDVPLPDRPSAEVVLGEGLTAPRLIAMSELPATTDEPARLVVLLDADDQTYVDAYEARSASTIVRVARTALPARAGPRERGLGLVGYHHRLTDRRRPVAMVVTHRSGTPVTRVMALVNGTAWTVLRESDQPCARDGCANAAQCGGAPPCAMRPAWGLSGASLTMVVHDQNGDGLADVTMGGDGDLQLRTFVSSAGDPDDPGPLDGCLCSSVGRAVPAFELARVGGPAPAVPALVVGDGTGAYLSYATAQGARGSPCDPRGGPLHCDFPLTCRALCAGDDRTARCMEPCSIGDPAACNRSPLRTECVAGVGSADGFCAEPVLSCRAPMSVLRLTSVFDLARAHLHSAELEDVVALGNGSPLGPALGGEFLRILRGGTHDLTDLPSLGPGESARVVTDLLPRAAPPRGGRNVEIGDLNGDGLHDLAVLYTETEEVRVWLGSSGGVPSEAGSEDAPARIRTDTCVAGGQCPCEPARPFVVADLDGAGNEEVVVVCTAQPEPRARWFRW